MLCDNNFIMENTYCKGNVNISSDILWNFQSLVLYISVNQIVYTCHHILKVCLKLLNCLFLKGRQSLLWRYWYVCFGQSNVYTRPTELVAHGQHGVHDTVLCCPL